MSELTLVIRPSKRASWRGGRTGWLTPAARRSAHRARRSALRAPRLAFRCVQSAIRNPQSAIVPLTPHPSPLTPRHGISLLELLVVIIIIVSITVVTIPAVLPVLANRRVREASRIINVFFAGARSRAMQTGRPVGVLLERFSGLPDAAMTLSYCEVPPPYSGDFVDSRATLGGTSVTKLGSVGGDDQGWKGIIRQGDLIKFNYQGHLFRVTGKDTSSPPDDFIDDFPLTLAPVVSGVSVPNLTQPVPYQIFRAPVKLAAGSVQLPEGAVVDLAFSGFDWKLTGDSSRPTESWTFQPFPNNPNDTSPIAITFHPSGSVDKVWCYEKEKKFADNPAWGPQDAVTPIHLLIGRRDLLPVPATYPAYDANKIQLNWHDPANLWVSINPQTGLVATTENAVPDPASVTTYDQLLNARRFARESHVMGGR